jgi:NADPH:quinone reductase-like Zn-dependent oxidoreductase
MRAITYSRTGSPSVLTVQDVPVPEPAPSEVRIRVVAASANRLDAKLRSGQLRYPQPFPVIPGMDAAGIVDAVGSGISHVRVGDAVFGPGRGTYAEYAVLTTATLKPDHVDFVSAAAITTIGEAALRGLALTGVQAGGSVLVHGAAGGVGSVAVQLARLQQLRVVGTAAAADLPFVRSLGAAAITYGPGWADRVRVTTPVVDGVLDTSGAGVLPESIGLARGTAGVVTLADPHATELGVRFTHAGADERRYDSYPALIALLADGRLTVHIEATYDLKQAAAMHHALDEGKNSGKLVLTMEVASARTSG